MSSDYRFLNIISSSLSEAEMTYSWFNRWSISSDKVGSGSCDNSLASKGSCSVSLGCDLGSYNDSLASNGIIMGSGW